MKIHHLSVAEALASLSSGTNGLTQAEATHRLQEFGQNRVEHLVGLSLWLRFLQNFTHFFALILWLAAGLAFVAKFFDPGEGMATLGWAILGVILINGVFSFWQEYRAERALAALENLLPRQVKVRRDGQARQVPAEEIVPGDLLLLAEGDDVPADCRLIEAFSVRVNLATVTGESLPKAMETGPSAEENFLHAKNVLLAGTALVSGEAQAVVFATGAHTEFGKIARLTQTAAETISPLQREIAHLSRLVAALATLLGAVFFLIGHMLGLTFWQNFIFAIGIIVANVPEGLLPTVTLALAMATQRMAARNALVRHLPAVETLGAATVILTDKTGTLTQNRMAVKRLFLAGDFVTPAQAAGDPALAAMRAPLFEAARLCHDLKAAGDEWLGDPMEIALVQMARRAPPRHSDCPKVDEIPFDAERKRLSTLHRTMSGLTLYTKGAPETVLPLCRFVLTAGGIELLTAEWEARFDAAHDEMMENGLRVLAFACRSVAADYQHGRLEEEMVLVGLTGLEDPPRQGVPEAVAKCREAGIRVIMCTGDHPRTATAIGREIGLIRSIDPTVITGEALRRMSNTQLQLALNAPEILFARVSADQKLRVVTALKRKKHIVAVTGDGVNDAPALKHADIGIAMGLSGTDVARESADMILLDDNFASIVAAVEEGRAVYDNIRKFLTYILTHNFAELVPYLAFVLFRIPLPLTVMQILAIDLVTDTMPALALGAEAPHPSTMKRPPRPRSQRLLDWPLALRAYLFLGVIEATAAMAAFFFVLHAAGWHYGQELARLAPLYLQATTATLSAIILMQVVNVFLCRDSRDSLFTSGTSGNRLILGGIAVELALILLIDYTPWGNRIFDTAPIGAEVWLFVIPFAAGMVVLEEIRKWLVRKYYT